MFKRIGISLLPLLMLADMPLFGMTVQKPGILKQAKEIVRSQYSPTTENAEVKRSGEHIVLPDRSRVLPAKLKMPKHTASPLNMLRSLAAQNIITWIRAKDSVMPYSPLFAPIVANKRVIGNEQVDFFQLNQDETLLGCCAKNAVKIFDLSEDKCIKEFSVNSGSGPKIFNADLSRILIPNKDTWELWDVSQENRITIFASENGQKLEPVFSSLGNRIVCGGKIYDAGTGALVNDEDIQGTVRFSRCDIGANCIGAYNVKRLSGRDSKRLAEHDHLLDIWDTTTGRMVTSIPLGCNAWCSSDGALLAYIDTATDDLYIRDLNTNREAQKIIRDVQAVRFVDKNTRIEVLTKQGLLQFRIDRTNNTMLLTCADQILNDFSYTGFNKHGLIRMGKQLCDTKTGQCIIIEPLELPHCIYGRTIPMGSDKRVQIFDLKACLDALKPKNMPLQTRMVLEILKTNPQDLQNVSPVVLETALSKMPENVRSALIQQNPIVDDVLHGKPARLVNPIPYYELRRSSSTKKQ